MLKVNLFAYNSYFKVDIFIITKHLFYVLQYLWKFTLKKKKTILGKIYFKKSLFEI